MWKRRTTSGWSGGWLTEPTGAVSTTPLNKDQSLAIVLWNAWLALRVNDVLTWLFGCSALEQV